MLRPFLPDCNRGFTVLELLVANMVGLILVALTLSAVTSNRRLYQYDLVRTRLNQNLRSAMDVIGVNAREAGENLSSNFPAVKLINGTSGAPDELVFRRNLLDEVLKVCEQIDSGTGTGQVKFAVAGSVPGCSYSDQAHNYDTWRNYRIDNGGTVRAYIYDQASGLGEFFNYNAEADSDPEYLIYRNGGSWDNTYPVGTSAVYIIEEWHFKLDSSLYEDTVLQVIEDGLTADPMNIVFGITDFQVEAIMQDDSVQDELNAGESWTDLQAISVTLNGEDFLFNKNLVARELTAQFFPRNILSN